jgi:hypothetical protein
MTALSRQVIRTVAERMRIEAEHLTSTRRGKVLVAARIEVAKLLSAHGYSLGKIGRIMNRDHSTIHFYLGRASKKPRAMRWRAPKVRHVTFIKAPLEPPAPTPPPQDRRRYLVAYAGADGRYKWKKRPSENREANTVTGSLTDGAEHGLCVGNDHRKPEYVAGDHGGASAPARAG